MKFSEYFGLGLSQAALDFVDVDLETDTPLYIDPYALSTRTDQWSADCATSVQSFFQELVTAIRADDRGRAIQLLSNLHEPNETCLGQSAGRPSGRGVGGLQSTQLHEALSRSAAVRTGFVQDLADCELVVDGIGPDKISDITTNLIRRQLIEYTRRQCEAHGIQLVGQVPSGPMWDVHTLRWEDAYVPLPVVNDRRIILVPKFAVRWHTSMNYREYYSQFVLNYIRANPVEFGLAHLARGPRGGIRRKDIEDAYPCGKAFLLEFSQHHPEIFEDYKEHKAAEGPLTHEQLADTDRRDLGAFFKAQLAAIPLGRAGETDYHRLIAGILSYLFYPNLVAPQVEERINDGRKRIDITYNNAAESGLFRRFTPTTGRESLRIVAECKNYSRDVGNEEVDQVLGRFAANRGWLGLLMSRVVQDRDLLMARCRDLARGQKAYIVPLDDSDVLRMLDIAARDGDKGVMEYFEGRFQQLTL